MLSEILGQNEYAVPVASHCQLLDRVPVPVLDQGTNEPGGNPGVFNTHAALSRKVHSAVR